MNEQTLKDWWSKPGNSPEGYVMEVAADNGKPAPVVAVVEVAKWSTNDIPPLFARLSRQDVVEMRQAMYGDLDRQTQHALQLLEAHAAEDPSVLKDTLVESALLTARFDLPANGVDSRPFLQATKASSAEELAEILPEEEAFGALAMVPCYRAARIGQVVRGLERCGLAPDLRARMIQRMDEILDKCSELANFQEVPIANAVRAMIDVGMISLKAGLELHGVRGPEADIDATPPPAAVARYST
jgi:hypothetical protein